MSEAVQRRSLRDEVGRFLQEFQWRHHVGLRSKAGLQCRLLEANLYLWQDYYYYCYYYYYYYYHRHHHHHHLLYAVYLYLYS